MTAAPPRPAEGDLTLVGRAAVEVRRGFGSLLAFGVVSRLVASLAIGPATSWVVAALVERRGRYSFGNNDILTLALSPYGVLLGVGVGTLLFFAQTAEIAGLLVLGRAAFTGHPTSFLRACWRTARAGPHLLGLAFRQWLA